MKRIESYFKKENKETISKLKVWYTNVIGVTCEPLVNDIKIRILSKLYIEYVTDYGINNQNFFDNSGNHVTDSNDPYH